MNATPTPLPTPVHTLCQALDSGLLITAPGAPLQETAFQQ